MDLFVNLKYVYLSKGDLVNEIANSITNEIAEI